jgi:hypothetical protein
VLEGWWRGDSTVAASSIFSPIFFPVKTGEHKRRGLNKGAEENRERAEKRGGRSKEKKKETEKRMKKKT